MTIATSNTAPVANAGPNQTVAVGATVTLDGSGSTDAEGNPLAYQWSFVSVPTGSAATFSNPTAAKPTFVADKAGQYVAQLVVNDGTVNSLPDTVTATTTSLNTAPVANARPDHTVPAGSTVQLDGSASKDIDGNALRYQWALTVKPTGSKATLSNATTMMASFTADTAGQYVAQLIVNDGMINSAPDTVIIKTSTLPQASGIYIQRARWIASTGKLTVVGRAPKNATVQIIDADSGTLLTTVTAGNTGRFRAYLTPVPFVPCAVQATTNGLSSVKTPVAGAPANCGANGGAPVVQKNQERRRMGR
ncbi:MAG TPA: PKD domain-containing protein [Nitrospira sp.]|nr:PKD domain-containing protein [Nitrospira sp.]